MMLFFGLLFFIFLQIIRPQDFVPGLKGTRLVLYLMVILLGALLLSPIEKKIIKSPQDKYAGLFFMATVLSAFSLFWISYIIDVSIETLKSALMFYFIVMVVDSERKFRITVWTIVVLMGVVASMGVLQYHGYDITGAGMAWSAAKQVWLIRGIGNFDNPNDLAYSVVLVVPFALGFVFQSEGFWGRITGILLFSLAIYCIYLTKSRGGQIALVASLGSWIYFWIKNPKRKKQIVILAIAGIMAAATMQVTGYREDESAMGRVEAWSKGWELLKKNPIIGVGKDQFIEHYKKDSHSSYVRAGAELGLLGLYAFMGMIYSASITILKMQQPSVDQKWRAFYSGFGAFLVSFIAGSSFSTRTYDLIFLLCVALIGIMGRLSLQDSEDVNSVGVLFPEVTAKIWNKNVFGITIAVLIFWYIFLRQVW